jgi:PAS domain S-box-containing protein
MDKKNKDISLNLEEVGDFLAKFTENSDHIYWISSPDFKRIKYISPSYERIWGRSREELYQNPEVWITYLHPDDTKNHHPIHEMAEKIALLGGKARYSEQYRIIQPNGEIRWIRDHGFPLYNNEGICYGVTGIAIDVTDQKIIEQQLREANIKAETANLAKTEFIANMSHDIRTPLTGVIGLSEILELTLQNPEEKEKALLLHDSGEQLLRMLNAILEDVRVEHTGEQQIKEESFDLHQCIHDLVKLESPATTVKQLNFKAQIESGVPRFIRSDRNKIHRILLNLIGNAIKFTQSGCITLGIDCLHLDAATAHLKFSVSDTGIGIPVEAQSQVFNRFFKVSSSYKGIYEGNGLGLHIAQSYVELLGGHITLTSKVGIGSTFNFDIVCDLGERLEESQKKYDMPTTNSPTSPQNLNLHLLLVEDNAIALKTLELLLKQKGYTYASASTGEEAWAMFHSQLFDLMITDIGLPGISGTQLSLRIRNQERELGTPTLPIIGLTGHARESALEECMQSGINEVLSKPAQIEALHQCILKITQNSAIQSKENPSTTPPKTSLGIDLPATEDELFQLDQFPLFDEAMVLQHIQDKQLLITLLNTYLSDEMQHDMTLLQQEHEQQNWAEVEKIAHKIKGGVAYLGTEKMRYACQYLERYYKAGHSKLLEPLYLQILQVNEHTNNVLKIWLQNNSH